MNCRLEVHRWFGRGFGLAAVASAAAASSASAQQFALDRFVISSGGGTSTNGQFSLTGTIGQHDAGRLTGGSFALDGGFHSVAVAIQTPGAPLLVIVRSGSSYVVSWGSASAGFVLEEVASLVTPANWQAVTIPPVLVGQENQVTIPASSGARFYRLKRP